MSHSKKNRILLAFTSLAVCGVILAFQNCSNKVQFQVSDQNSSISGGGGGNQEDETVSVLTAFVGAPENLPHLKLFFVVDNSSTMKANNIALDQSFAEMFKGDTGSSLGLFDTSVYLFTTTQNLQSNPSVTPDRSLPVIAQFQNRNVDAVRSRSVSDLQNTERTPTTSGVLPGDLLGFEIIKKNNNIAQTTDYDFLPVPVLGFLNDLSGKTLVLPEIHKAARGSVEDLATEFSKRLAVINPASYNTDVVFESIDKEKVARQVGAESGLCSVARILRDKDRFLASGDQAAFIVVSDEDDAFANGQNCIRSFATSVLPNQPLRGTCQAQESNFSFTHKRTKIDYDYTVSKIDSTSEQWSLSYFKTSLGSSASCTANAFSQFKVSYQLNPLRTKITYREKLVADGITTFGNTITDFANNVDLSAKCDQAGLAGYLSKSADFTGANKPVCVFESPSIGAVNMSAFPTATQKFNYSSVSAKPTVASVCSSEVLGLLSASLPDVASGNRTIANCSVTSIFETSQTANLSMSSNGSSADCDALVNTYCLDASRACAKDGSQKIFKAAVSPTKDSRATSRTFAKSPVSCEANCDSMLCGSFTGTIKQYVASKDGVNESQISDCSVSQLADAPKTLTDRNSVTCDSACSDTADICPSTKNQTVRNFLSQSRVLKSCSSTQVNLSSVATKPSMTVNEQLSCDQACNSTKFLCAKDTTGADVKTFLASNKKIRLTSCTSTALADQTVTVKKTGESILHCNSSCSSTNSLCPTRLSSVEDYLISSESTLAAKEIVSCAVSNSLGAARSVSSTSANTNNICLSGEQFTSGSSAAPDSEPTVDFVSGNASKTQANDLVSFIDQRTTDIFGENRPFFSAFVVRDESERNATQNQSVGTQYIKLASKFGSTGSVNAVSSGNYAPALKDLSRVINERMSRTIVFPMPPEAKMVRITRVWIKFKGATDYRELTVNEFVAHENSVSIVPGIQLNISDEVKAEIHATGLPVPL